MWRSINTFYLNNNWQYSSPVQGEIFRVKSYYIDNFNNQYLKGVVASIFVDDQQIVNLVESRRLSYRLEPEIFTFYFPPGLGNQRIGVKRLDTTNLDWSVEVEVFQSANPNEDFENYFISRFGQSLGELMATYNRAAAFTSQEPNSNRVELNPREGRKILDANGKRRNLIITNGSGNNIVICGAVAENGTPSRVMYTLLPNEEHELPINNGIYTGEVFLVNMGTTRANAAFVEYNALI